MATALQTIPGHRGLPVVGSSLELVRDARSMIARCHEDYGSLFRLYLLGRWVVVALGAEANEQVLIDKERAFSSAGGWRSNLRPFFPGGLLLRDGEDHHAHRRALQHAFRGPALRRYLAQMQPTVAACLDRLPIGRSFEFHPEVKQLTLDVAARTLLGLDLGDESRAINEALSRMAAATVAPLKLAIPGSVAARGIRARRWLEGRLFEIVSRRRGSAGDDALSLLCAARLPDGSSLSDEQIVSHVSFLLLAGHDTSAASLTTTAWALASHPDWQDRAREACLSLDATGTDGPPEAIAVLDRIFDEVLRLEPPVAYIPRQATRAVSLCGHEVPAGTVVLISPDFTHRQAEHWDEPERFNPDRFRVNPTDDPRTRYAYIPFGGGAHRCQGEAFARLEHRSILRGLLSRGRLSLEPGYRPNFQQVPIPRPRDGLPIRLDVR